MQTALNTMWEVEPKPGQGIKRLLRQRLSSLGALAGLLFLLLVALVLTTAVTALVGTFTGGASAALAYIVNLIVSLIIFTLIFGFMFKVVPEAKVRWRDVWLGGAVTAVLFAIGREGIGFYLSYTDTASYFGAAGSLVLLIIFIYYSAQIVFIGAEFTQVYANRYGGGLTPEKHAQAIPGPPEEARGGAGAQAVKPPEDQSAQRQDDAEGRAADQNVGSQEGREAGGEAAARKGGKAPARKGKEATPRS